MGRNIKCKPTNLCMIIFMLCLLVRFVEYFLIETDKTAIGENVLHKAVGIILLAPALKYEQFPVMRVSYTIAAAVTLVCTRHFPFSMTGSS